MAYRIISPINSFVRFGSTDVATSCNFRDIPFCLPVFEEEDIYFQFVIEADTSGEADALCDLENELLTVGISGECPGAFIHEFAEKPDRFRISDFQVLYNWSHGLPGIFEVVNVGDCFFVRVEADELLLSDCTNCLQRIGSDCHTSVLEYGNEDNFAGFNYCNSAGVDSGGGELDCSPTFVSFTNAATLTIPYTAAMIAKYGNIPTLKVWIYDGTGALINMSVTQSFDTYPPTELRFDFGGLASGVLKIS